MLNKEFRIDGKEVYLRPMMVEDTDLIIKWRNSDIVRRYFIYQKPFTREGHLEWIRTMIEPGNGYQFIACMKEDDRPIGSTYLRDFDREHGKIEYGLFIGEEVSRGKGIGSQLAALTCKFAFDDLNVNKVFCKIFAWNKASTKSVMNAGFKEEGYLTRDVKVQGEYQDMILFGMFQEDLQRQLFTEF